MTRNHIILMLAAVSALPLTGSTVAVEGARRAGSRLAVGHGYSCVVREYGAVQCWGWNFSGQLGDTTTTQRLTPGTVVGLSNAIAVTAGFAHVCALDAAGTVQCWGENTYGKLGRVTTGSYSSRAAPVTGLTAIQVDAGRDHTCAVLISGSVQCWGNNDWGQLGNGTTTDSTTPVTVIGPGGTALSGVVSVALGQMHSCALTVSAEVYCWGENLYGEAAEPFATIRQTTASLADVNIVLLAAGDYHTCVVGADRAVRCWGKNDDGQLGDGTRVNRDSPATAVSGPRTVTGITAGLFHSCLWRVDATVECWGNNPNGQLGIGTTAHKLTPGFRVLDLSSPVEVAAGSVSTHTCALLADDSVRCWGNNSHGELGDGTVDARLSAVTAVAAGSYQGRLISIGTEHTCAVRSSGKPDCWGANGEGQLGDGTTAARTTPNSTIPVTGIAGVVQVGSGNRFACSLEATGRVKCWGDNAFGQLGNGSNSDSLTPVNVSAANDFTMISVSEEHVCGTKAGGRVVCWGSNSAGQLGDGSTANRSTPVTVSGVSDSVMVASGWYHTCSLRAGGTVQCWGSNSNGQLGDGTTTSPTAPVTVTGLANVVSISAGQFHTCARLSGGTVQCWGFNIEGQIGDGTTTQRPIPTAVTGLTDAVTVTAHAEFTCALRSNGRAQCWGDNFHGQLGDGTTTDRLTPVTVTVLNNILSLGATSDNLVNMANCALLASGVPYCWGNNLVGKLGDGTTTTRPTPAAVATF